MADLKDPRAVFVVHGRNENLRDAMFSFLRSINLSPMEWTKAVELTRQGSPYIGSVLDTAFDHAMAIVVLMTPDEIAYLQTRFGRSDEDPETRPASQARPNVLFEAGMALGRDAKRTILVEIGDLRAFSDIAGRHAIRMDNSAEKRQALVKRLETAGCAVETGTDWLTTGDFAAPSPPGDGLPLARRLPSSPSRPAVLFDLKYQDRGSSRMGRLQVINRGTETVYDVDLEVPADAALDLRDRDGLPIAKIPSAKSVTIDALSTQRFLGGSINTMAFDVKISGRTESGKAVAQDVFIDMNG